MTRILQFRLFVAQTIVSVRFAVAHTANFFFAVDGKVKKGLTSRVERRQRSLGTPQS
jgi:hypothetical protein